MNESQVFANALKLADSSGRAAYLDEACAGDPELRADVEALLQAHANDPGFLEQPVGSLMGTVEEASVAESPAAPPADPAGTGQSGVVLAGRYRLLELIGEGGMGAVWMAQQLEPVKRLVAVKLIKPGMDSQQVLARFDAERQALALMDHPSIARVFDAGMTPDRRPFFVMELVKGVPITRYGDQHRLTPRQRLELFIPVCQAIQHAHQKGIIHRDIKPSNVLVALYDDRPVVKVIDFGIAKATGQSLTESTLHTGFGAIVGTVEYMSPEQASFNQLDVDTRSDIYSLGVLLYELLTGSPPFGRKELEKVGLLEVLRVIREQEPPRPSTRLSTADGLPTLAANRGTEPRRLAALMRGELDWIVMKALEKDRSRRYDTANGLAADVQRYLAGEPVQAVPPSVGYRLRKFVRRNRLPLGVITAVALVLVAAVVGLAISNSLIQQEKEAKEQALTDLLREEQHKAQEAQGRAEANASWKRTAYYLKTSLVLNEWRAVNRAWAAQHLAECPDEMRHWEWDYLNRLCNGQSRDVPLGGPDDRWSAAFNPTATRVATVDRKGVLHLYDAEGKELFNLSLASCGRNYGVRFSQDGTRMATLSEVREGKDARAMIQVWDSDSGKQLAVVKAPPFSAGWHVFMGLGFSPDSTRIAGIDMRGHLLLHDLVKHVELWRADAHPIDPNPHPNFVWYTSLAFSPDGSRIATVSEFQAEGKVWDATTGKPVMNFKSGGEGFSSVLYSPKGTWLVTTGRYRDDTIIVPDTTVRLWDARTGQQLRVFQGGARPVTSLAISPDETRLAAGTRDGAVILWDLVTGQKIGTYNTRDRDVYHMAFSVDGRTLATTTRGFTPGDTFGRMIQFWDATRGPESRAFRCLGAHQAALSPDGRLVLAVARHPKEKRQMAVLWDADTGDVVRELGGPRECFLSVACSPDGKMIAIAVQPEIGICPIRLHDPRTGQLLRTLATPDGKPGAPCDTLAFSADGTRLASGAQDQVVRVWEVTTGRQLWESKKQERTVSGLGFSRDGKRLVSATGGIERVSPTFTGNPKAPQWPTDFQKTVPVLKVWNAETGQELMSLDLPGKTQAVAISPDGETVAVGFGDSKMIVTIRFAPGTNGAEVADFEDSGGGDRSVRLYRVPTGEVVGTLKGHAKPTRSLAFSPDGRRIVTAGGSDNTVKLWDAKSGEEILTLGPQPGIVTCVGFSANGVRIVSGSLQEARVWDATPLKK